MSVFQRYGAIFFGILLLLSIYEIESGVGAWKPGSPQGRSLFGWDNIRRRRRRNKKCIKNYVKVCKDGDCTEEAKMACSESAATSLSELSHPFILPLSSWASVMPGILNTMQWLKIFSST